MSKQTIGSQARMRVIPISDSLFAERSPEPVTDREALMECAEVLERIMRDNVLCGVGSMTWNKEGKMELPLYGCAEQALNHSKQRLEQHA